MRPGKYGRIICIELNKHDRRIFTPTPWGSPMWRRGYNRRSAMERINARLDRSFDCEFHYTHSPANIKARVGLALAVMMVPALPHLRARPAERIRSLVGAIQLRDIGLCFLRLSPSRPTVSAVGRRDPAATSAIMFRHRSNRAENRHIPIPPQICAHDIHPIQRSAVQPKNATAHMPTQTTN